MFGTKHIIILLICLVYILASIVFLNKKKPALKTVLRILLVIGLFSETLKIGSYIVANEATYGGYLPKTDLPFHLCSVQIIFMPILVLSGNEKLKRVLYAFMLPTCLIGGIAALLIPTSSSLSMPVVTVQYFLYHASITVYAVYLYLTKEIRFEIKDYVSSLLMLYGFFFVSIYLNSWINDYSHPINFMYVVAPPKEGLPYLNKDNGWLSYILRYAFLAVVCVTACYVKPICRGLARKFGKNSTKAHGKHAQKV